MFFDSTYMMLALFGLLLTGLPQLWVKNTYQHFTKVPVRVGITGADVARKILAENNISDVVVESTPGELSDHYDPRTKVVRLSENIYHGRSVSSLGIAAHEVGHAIQDNKGYLPMKIRAGLFPAVMMGQMLGPWLMIIGMMMRSASHFGFGDQIAIIGLIFYASVFLFQLVTLPVEINASQRAIRALADGGYLVEGEEISGGKKVLTAAACTYIAAALYSLLELAYWAWRVFGSRERD
jgi:Zn-dependent membrane protease YugP